MNEATKIRELTMKIMEEKIIETGFLEEHDKNVGGTLYSPESNRNLTASAIADVLSVYFVPKPEPGDI